MTEITETTEAPEGSETTEASEIAEQSSKQETEQLVKSIPHPSVDLVKSKYNNRVDWIKQAINFKTTKVKGPDGELLEYKRPGFEVEYPRPSVEGLVEIFNEAGKGLELLVEAVDEKIYAHLRVQINDLIEAGGEVTAEMIDVSKLTWDYLANLSKADKRSAAISKETWDAFSKDYINVIMRVTGKPIDKVIYQARILVNKFQKVKGKEDAILFLKTNLDIWFSNTEQSEEFEEIYSLLTTKANEAMKEDQASLLANLGM